MKILDCILLSAVRWRLARCRRAGDAADRFGDCLVATMEAEIRRRNLRLAGWAAERRGSERSAAERARRDAAVQNFQNFERENRLKLQ
jgi:hypothetical protein